MASSIILDLVLCTIPGREVWAAKRRGIAHCKVLSSETALQRTGFACQFCVLISIKLNPFLQTKHRSLLHCLSLYIEHHSHTALALAWINHNPTEASPSQEWYSPDTEQALIKPCPGWGTRTLLRLEEWLQQSFASLFLLRSSASITSELLSDRIKPNC